ncbi:MAG: hypothetical protein NTY02_20350 [Acidobacteria bacterium]|nr:hypothetical protein [Acidobacteriota bacterium]
MTMPEPELPFSWDTEFSLVTDRFVLYDGAKLFAWTYGIVAVLFTAIFLLQGEPRAVLPLLGMFALAVAGLALLAIAIMAVIFRNRFQARITISAHGVVVESRSRVGRILNRVAAIGGALGRSPTTAGAGLLAMSSESVGIEWTDVRRVRQHADQLVLSLMNSWRVVLRIYCTPENYDQVRDLVTRQAGAGTAARAGRAAAGGAS